MHDETNLSINISPVFIFSATLTIKLGNWATKNDLQRIFSTKRDLVHASQLIYVL
jgi:hypothetical protein